MKKVDQIEMAEKREAEMNQEALEIEKVMVEVEKAAEMNE